jgi:ABC-type microcin C transport system duplicated ATPase subunit YejF
MTYAYKLSTGHQQAVLAGAAAVSPPLLLAAGATDAAPKQVSP